MKFHPALAALISTAALHAAPIPLALPRPDGKPGDASKPVKVYVLAGQSNMVGMGDIQGASPRYPSIYLSADPAIIEGQMHAGTSRGKGACQWYWQGEPGLRKHGLYQDKDGKTKALPTGTVNKGVTKYFIDVPTSGNYLVHVGHGESSYATASLSGKEVYRKEAGAAPTLTKTTLEAGKLYPLEINYAQGGSAALWLEQTDLVGVGDLVTLTRKDGKFTYLLDEKGGWSVRNDVYYQEARVAEEGKGSPLSATSNGKSIGPEVGFGAVMGTFHDEQVLLIKTAMGNRSLKFDFRPPSSGRQEPDSPYESYEYNAMLKGVRTTLENIDKVVPGYKGQGYEIVGFGWFQGHKDSGSTKEEYEGHLVNLIKDLRKDLKAPNMKAVVATVGFHGYRINTGNWKGVWEAQMAVGDPKQHPELVGHVASVDTRDYWRELDESPRNQDYHYHRNPETYLLTGEAMGRAMVRLLGGEAVEIPKSDREAKTLAAMKLEAETPAPSAEQVAASIAACKPMVLDGLLPTFLKDARNQKALAGGFVTSIPKPAKHPEYLEDAIDDVAAFFEAANIDSYSWKPVLPAMATCQWDIFSFNVENNPYKQPAPAQNEKPKAAPMKLTLPAGLENWFAVDFDAKKAGWKSAAAPFGKTVPKEWPENVSWIVKYPLYPAERPQPTTVINDDVLLMRGKFDLPPSKEGHRYRVVVSGSINANSGEGFSIYANGKLLGERKSGVNAWRKQGKSGSAVWTEFMADFKGGPLTLAVANFPMNDFKPGDEIPAIGPLSVTIEEQKLPDPGIAP